MEIVRYEIGAAVRTAASARGDSRQARVQRGFYRIASLLGEPVSPAEAYDAAAQAATDALGGDFAAVLARGAGGSSSSAATICGPRFASCRSRRRLPTPPRTGTCSRPRSRERRPIRRRMARRAVQLAARDPSARGASGARRGVLRRGSRVLADDLELAQQVARAARGAFERSRLFDAERTARSLAQQLARTGSLLATELDPAAVIDAVVTEAASCCAWMRRRSRRSTTATSWSLQRPETVPTARSASGPRAGAAHREMSSGRAPRRRYEDAAQNDSLREETRFLAAGHAAYLGVPLSAPDGGLYGVLSVYGRAPRVWREEEVQALVALAANAAAALTNAELYQRVAVEREQSVAILANIADGIVAVDRDGHVVLWNRAAEEITGVPATEAVGRTPARCCSASSSRRAGAPTGSSRSSAERTTCGCRSPRR